MGDVGAGGNSYNFEGIDSAASPYAGRPAIAGDKRPLNAFRCLSVLIGVDPVSRRWGTAWPPCPRLGSLLLLLLLTVPEAWAGGPLTGKPNDPQAPRPGLSSLPAEAKASISAALGRDQVAYHAKGKGSALWLDNPRHRLRANFTAAGVELRSASASFRLQLTGLGRGARLEAVAAATPEAKANRVEYRRSGLTEWYVNGPLGLEQGFTLDQPPPARPIGEALTVALRLAGEVTAVPDRNGDGMVLQASEGPTLLRYRGLIAWDAKGRTLPAWWTVVGRDVRLRVDDTNARYPLTIDPFFEQAKLTASDGAAGDDFGDAVALSGDTVVVGADEDDIGANTSQGSAYVFVRPPGGWAGLLHENAKLTATDGAAFDDFGLSVAVNGDVVVVGAPIAEIGENFNQGSAYIFVRPLGGWAGLVTEQAKLTALDGAAFDLFGASVAVDGDTVVVGAHGDDIGTNSNQGSAYVFVKPPGGWAGALTEQAKLTASDGAASDDLGFSVAVSGDTVAVGAPFDDIGSNNLQGSAYVFVRPPGGWAGARSESAILTASDGVANGLFGASVAASGNTVVVGADLESSGQPAAYVFLEPNGGWAGALTENAKLNASDGAGFDVFRGAVAVSGDTVVGSAFDNSGQAAAYVFFKPNGGWAGTRTEDVKLTASDGAASDEFGSSVAVSGDTVVVGADEHDIGGNADQGSAYVFALGDLFSDLSPAELARPQVACQGSRCKVSITCNLPQGPGIPCTNRIDLFVRASAARLSEDAAAKAPRRIRFAFGISNIPPGETKNVRLRLTGAGRRIARMGKRRLRGVFEIRNTPGILIDRTPVRIRLR